jgi:hypothetical protein
VVVLRDFKYQIKMSVPSLPKKLVFSCDSVFVAEQKFSFLVTFVSKLKIHDAEPKKKKVFFILSFFF